jgi:hypothetical protein
VYFGMVVRQLWHAPVSKLVLGGAGALRDSTGPAPKLWGSEKQQGLLAGLLHALAGQLTIEVRPFNFYALFADI